MNPFLAKGLPNLSDLLFLILSDMGNEDPK